AQPGSDKPTASGHFTLNSTSWTLKYWTLDTGDLFSCPRDESLVHCIRADIAVMFEKKFGRVSELKEQKKLPGQCAVLTLDQRFIYYLITKKTAGLEDMKSHCLQNGANRLSIPRIGCGLDQLQWSEVSQILDQVFKETNISTTVSSLPCVGLKLQM
uniref:O-acyl-ADP-ribose deacylase 1 n=2 Tax=Poecilia reticulata TaxID=8081 RepID=A0A3P9Q618_POERE